MKHCAILMLGVTVLLLAGGCKGKCATTEASAEEVELVQKAVDSYFQQLAAAKADPQARVPAWLAGVQSGRVVKVEKMRFAFKALVELKQGKRTTAKYFLIKRQNGRCEVSGIL